MTDPVSLPPEPAESPSLTGVELRADVPRAFCQNDHVLTILVRPQMKRYSVVLRDVSPNGMAFWMEEPLEPGTVIGMQRAVRNHTGSWVRSGRVAHCTPDAGLFLVGCTLSPSFGDEELEALS